jgi:tRNA dimethylallyltransferase
MSDLLGHFDLPPSCEAVLIAGPTAAGKSAFALELAKAVGGAIVNADSMQVYCDLRLLSARPSKADEAAAPHRLYGHVAATERYSLGRYRADAATALAEVRAMGRLPIFVGGSGMYFGVLTDGIADIPPIPEAVRQQARAKLAAIGVAALHGELAGCDPQTAATLRPSDPQRVLRAYEVFAATGRPLVEWQQTATLPVLAGLKLAKYVIDIPRAILRERIATRFQAMLAAGAMAEAVALAGLPPTLPAAKMLGLRELIAAAEGRMTIEEATRLAVTATRQFAKRQTTWFRHRMADWTWLSVTMPPEA